MIHANHEGGFTRAVGSEPVVRPYALTGGRTRPSGPAIDVAAMVSVAGGMLVLDRAGAVVSELGPEHIRALRCCSPRASVADIAAELDLPLGVVRILLADLRERGLVRIRQPVPPGLHDAVLLKEVADALRRL